MLANCSCGTAPKRCEMSGQLYCQNCRDDAEDSSCRALYAAQSDADWNAEMEFRDIEDNHDAAICDCNYCENARYADATHGDLTQELPAISFDDVTEIAPIYEYVPPKCPANDMRLTVVELRAIGGE